MTDSLTGRRVLIVEDEMIIAMGLEDMVEQLGCRVVATAARPSEALAAIEKFTIDVAILDVNLDGQKSYDIAAALAHRNVPFVFSTGYASPGASEGYRDRPMLRKPFSATDLERTLTTILMAGKGA